MSTTIWFTGLSGSGKSTLANYLIKHLRDRGEKVVLLDGNDIRSTLSKDLGYSKEDRDKHITRVAELCSILNKNHVIVIASTISPTKKIREYARSICNNFIEVYIKCDLATCYKRDPRGLYKNKDNPMAGREIPYEEPDNPEITITTNMANERTSSRILIDEVIKKLFKDEN